MSNIRQPIPKKFQDELVALGVRLESINEEKSKLKKMEDALKARIREIALQYDLPIKEGPSQYLILSSGKKSLRITRPEKTPKLNPEVLREKVGNDTFHDICTVTSVDFDVSKWRHYLDREEVTSDMLYDSIIPDDPDAPESITIALSSPKGEEIEDQDDLI